MTWESQAKFKINVIKEKLIKDVDSQMKNLKNVIYLEKDKFDLIFYYK